ncbi:MAG: hypothetical protein HOD92_15545 [Deltaproteobacteria bacterium]|jgi:hypothetical protein|nr:hypothetical protein [Deltaproteobacteria bacterium]MBT4526116.1 hypothetical protein [Deltaproteobacteria bacterium]
MDKIKKFEFTSILGWSSSRYDLFTSCKRKYFYNYYAKFDEDFTKAHIDALKRLTSIPLEIGNIVHDVNKVILERLQKTARPIDPARFQQYILNTTMEYCHAKTFQEIYYQKLNQINFENDVFPKVNLALNNFLQNQRFNWLLSDALPASDQWVVEPGGFGETRINNLKAYCKVDFLFPVGDELFIIDWKTGKAHTEKHKKQMLGYTSWASYHYGIPAEKIVPIVVYLLPDYQETSIRFNQTDIEHFNQQVKDETVQMYEYCTNVNENVPRIKSDFPLTEQKIFCNYCSYKELCFPD